jgi:hypothetical protein
LPVAEKSQSRPSVAIMRSRASRLRAASARSATVVLREVFALQAARNGRPHRHWRGSSCGLSFSGDDLENSSFGNWPQMEGAASGCT